MEITREPVSVMYVSSPIGSDGAKDAFKQLEDAIDWQLKGRKFYGTQLLDEYRANLEIIDEDEVKRLGFPTWEIPGGKYYRQKIEDWEKHILEIGSTCDEIITRVSLDQSRPIIEYYRSQKELFLFIPIL